MPKTTILGIFDAKYNYSAPKWDAPHQNSIDILTLLIIIINSYVEKYLQQSPFKTQKIGDSAERCLLFFGFWFVKLKRDQTLLPNFDGAISTTTD